METLVGLVFVATPFIVTAALLLLVERRERRRRAEVARQVALTDALHARLGAVVAPMVRRSHRSWEVRIAVPFEQPDVVRSVVSTVSEVLGHVAYELRLHQQDAITPLTPQPRGVRAVQESVSWI
jgi:Zn-dependent M32 family carboxypeptidase